MTRPVVDLLYFEGCPNHEAARELAVPCEREFEVADDLVDLAASAACRD